MNNTIIPRDAASTVVERLAIHSLVFLLPFLALISNFGVGFCSFAFLLAAIVYWRAGRVALLRHLSEIRGVLIAFGLSFGLALAQMLLRHDLLRTLEKPSREMAAVTVLLTVLACRPSRKALWYGLIAGALAGAAFIVYQRWVIGVDRPGGLINSITFGDIVLCMGLMSLAGVLDFKGRQVVWPSLGALAGVVGSIATGTRGGWIAILFAIALFLQYGHFVRGKSIGHGAAGAGAAGRQLVHPADRRARAHLRGRQRRRNLCQRRQCLHPYGHPLRTVEGRDDADRAPSVGRCHAAGSARRTGRAGGRTPARSGRDDHAALP